MTQVDFYILAEDSHKQINQICCQLCEKALLQNLKVLIYSQSVVQAEKLDSLLWSFKKDSFIAHNNLLNQSNTDDSLSNNLLKDDYDYPVLISADDKPNPLYRDLLINLSAKPPPFHQQFKRIAELVDKDTQAKEEARTRYRFYQQQDYQLNQYNL